MRLDHLLSKEHLTLTWWWVCRGQARTVRVRGGAQGWNINCGCRLVAGAKYGPVRRVWNGAGGWLVVMGTLLGPEGTARFGGRLLRRAWLTLSNRRLDLRVWWVGAGCIWGSFVV